MGAVRLLTCGIARAHRISSSFPVAPPLPNSKGKNQHLLRGCVYVCVVADVHWQAFVILSLLGPCHYTVLGTALQELLVAVLGKKHLGSFSLMVAMKRVRHSCLFCHEHAANPTGALENLRAKAQVLLRPHLICYEALVETF